MPKNRVVIDTNLWISYLVSNNLSVFDTLIADNQLTLIFSAELVDEFIEVAQRKKFRKYFDLKDIEDLLIRIRRKALFINVTAVVTTCRDPKDNFLLALAFDSKATHLITGDKDLLVLENYIHTKILTLGEYLRDK